MQKPTQTTNKADEQREQDTLAAIIASKKPEMMWAWQSQQNIKYSIQELVENHV